MAKRVANFEWYKARELNDNWDSTVVRYRSRIRGANGKILFSSEAYNTKRACLAAIELVRGMSDAPVVEVEG